MTDERGSEAGNLAVVDGMHPVSALCTGLMPMAGNLRGNRLHHIGWVDGLTRYCAQHRPSMGRRCQLGHLGGHPRICDNERDDDGCRPAIDCPGQGRW